MSEFERDRVGFMLAKQQLGTRFPDSVWASWAPSQVGVIMISMAVAVAIFSAVAGPGYQAAMIFVITAVSFWWLYHARHHRIIENAYDAIRKEDPEQYKHLIRERLGL